MPEHVQLQVKIKGSEIFYWLGKLEVLCADTYVDKHFWLHEDIVYAEKYIIDLDSIPSYFNDHGWYNINEIKIYSKNIIFTLNRNPYTDNLGETAFYITKKDESNE